MKNMQLYIGGVNDITYRYDIQKEGDIFNVRVFSVRNHAKTESGTKRMRHISMHDVVDECLSHYHKRSSGVILFLTGLISNTYRFFKKMPGSKTHG